MYTKHLGRIGEYMCMIALLEKGFVNCSLVDREGFDIIVDVGGLLKKVEVKSCNINKRESRYSFNILRGSRGYGPDNKIDRSYRAYTKRDTDYFCFVARDLKKVIFKRSGEKDQYGNIKKCYKLHVEDFLYQKGCILEEDKNKIIKEFKDDDKSSRHQPRP